MQKDADGNLTLTSPQAWENFGQWLIYGVVAFLTIVVLWLMIKVLFPGKEKEEN